MHSNPIFQFLYSTTFTVLFICLLCLLLITPGDIIRQALINGQLYNVFAVAGVYLVTLIFAIILYASRLYTNRVVLAGIPKGWIPIEQGDVSDKVWRMICFGLLRSMAVAHAARPQDIQVEPNGDDEIRRKLVAVQVQPGRKGWMRGRKRWKASMVQTEAISALMSKSTDRSHIMHRGWSPPWSTDFPHLNYQTVVSELPNLIEAKAVSLAPPNESSRPSSLLGERLPVPAPPHPLAVALLQRPVGMGLRDYLAYLSSLNLITTPNSCEEFNRRYEHARFWDEGISDIEFRTLMGSFTEILQGMTELDRDILTQAAAAREEYEAGHDKRSSTSSAEPRTDTDANDDENEEDLSSSAAHSFTSTPSDQRSQASQGTVRTVPSFARTPFSGAGTPWMTAPATPHTTRRRGGSLSTIPAGTTSGIAGPSRRGLSSALSSRSSSLLTPISSSSKSGSATSSVIRLARPEDSEDARGLPYVFVSSSTASGAFGASANDGRDSDTR